MRRGPIDRTESYERLEFLGDSVLELAIAHELYDRYPDFSEGRLAKIRSHVVSRASCAVVARELDLGRRLGKFGIADLQADEIERLARTATCSPRCSRRCSARSSSSTGSRRSRTRS